MDTNMVVRSMHPSRVFHLVLRSEDAGPIKMYDGIRPEDSFSRQLTQTMTQALRSLFEASPSDATLHASLVRNLQHFELSVCLQSAAEVINAFGRGKSPLLALQRCLTQAYGKLVDWRSQRFHPQFSGHEFQRLVGPDMQNNLKLNMLAPKILIVDDDPVSTKLMETCLRQQGCDTRVVSSGKQAVSEITTHDYDLMVLDWNMPLMSGYEAVVCAQDLISFDASFRQAWLSNQLPILTYSGVEGQTLEYPDCKNFNFVDFIPKAAPYSELKSRTSQVLRELNLSWTGKKQRGHRLKLWPHLNFSTFVRIEFNRI